MSTKLLLVDLNGTIRRSKVNPQGFINTPLDQEIIPEADVALQRWSAAGAVIVGCSNQAGVAAKYKTLGECIDEQVETMRLAPHIRAVLFCPDSDGARCFHVQPDGSALTLTVDSIPELHIRSFRKPACGMLVVAMARYRANADSTVFVGDRDEDRLAAVSCGVEFIPHETWYAMERVQQAKEAT